MEDTGQGSEGLLYAYNTMIPKAEVDSTPLVSDRFASSRWVIAFELLFGQGISRPSSTPGFLTLSSVLERGVSRVDA